MSTETSQKTVTYLITVHGMGEQRDNETLSPVISRFVDVIIDHDGTDKKPYPRNTLSLGQITGQEDRDPPEYWAAFKDLTFEKLRDGLKKNERFIFNGVEAEPRKKPELVRFSDIYWQDVLREHWGRVGQATDAWVSAVVSRVFQDPEQPARLKSLIYTLEQTVDIAYYASKIKTKSMNKTAFEQYLGDVQIYTESPGCRFDAIAEFHKRMKLIHEDAMKEGIVPQYYIIAHSLGTMMSLDSLLKAAEQQLDWLANVEAFVTLGSPIDKVITLWNYNYEHLDLPLSERAKKIRHYNYSDEQDPVGYYVTTLGGYIDNETGKRELGKARYESVFTRQEDIVYNHCVVPGLAHTSYWEDIRLFRHIVRDIVAPSPPSIETSADEKRKKYDHTLTWYDGKVYTGVMVVTYFLIPLVIAGVNILTLTWALGAETWQARVISSFAFVISSWLCKQILSLLISWRLAANRGSRSKPFSGEEDIRKKLEKYQLNKWSKYLLWTIMLATSLVPALFFVWDPSGYRLTLSWGTYWPFLVTVSASLLVVMLLFSKKRKQQAITGKYMGGDFATALTVILSVLLLGGGIARNKITIASDSEMKDSLTKHTAYLFDPFFAGSAYAQPRTDPQPGKPQQPRPIQTVPPIIKFDTVHQRIFKYDTIHKPIVKMDTMRERVVKYDTTHTKVDILDTVLSHKRVGVTDTQRSRIEIPDTVFRMTTITDTTIVRDTVIASVKRSEKQNSALLYFSSLMTAFTCFSFSALKYLFEKGKINRMKKMVAKAKQQ